MSRDVFKKSAFSAVEGNTGLVRDNHSKAIINNDDNQRNQFRHKRRMMKQRMNEIKDINKEQQEKLCSLEKEVEQLKQLVHKILEE
jgi:hypothetical protein